MASVLCIVAPLCQVPRLDLYFLPATAQRGHKHRLDDEQDILLEENNSFTKSYVVAEVKIQSVYKGGLKAGDIVQVQQEYGQDGYVNIGYLKYQSDYILFLYALGDYYQLLLPSSREEITNGKFEHTLDSSQYGEITTVEQMAEYAPQIPFPGMSGIRQGKPIKMKVGETTVSNVHTFPADVKKNGVTSRIYFLFGYANALLRGRCIPHLA